MRRAYGHQAARQGVRDVVDDARGRVLRDAAVDALHFKGRRGRPQQQRVDEKREPRRADRREHHGRQRIVHRTRARVVVRIERDVVAVHAGVGDQNKETAREALRRRRPRERAVAARYAVAGKEVAPAACCHGHAKKQRAVAQRLLRRLLLLGRVHRRQQLHREAPARHTLRLSAVELIAAKAPEAKQKPDIGAAAVLRVQRQVDAPHRRAYARLAKEHLERRRKGHRRARRVQRQRAVRAQHKQVRAAAGAHDGRDVCCDRTHRRRRASVETKGGRYA